MPTYASTASFDLSIDEIAEEAYERCGLQVRSGYDLQTARRSLNLLLAEWANRGLNLWTIQLQEKTIAADTTSLTGTNLFTMTDFLSYSPEQDLNAGVFPETLNMTVGLKLSF